MADRPVPELGGRTPLEAAVKPHMDFLAQHGTVGMARTVPEGMPPGSDTANLSVMGYDPRIYYSGRSAARGGEHGLPLAADDVTFRCNLVNLSEEGALEDATMVDYSSDEITTAESTELIAFLNREFRTETRDLYPGISYRHCLVLRHAETGTDCTPPHDISLKPVRDCLPKGRYGEQLLDMMKRSYALLRDHPVNLARVSRGLRPANCCWFWGEGTRPALSSFEERFGVKGGVISAVDLIKGIGICAGAQERRRARRDRQCGHQLPRQGGGGDRPLAKRLRLCLHPCGGARRVRPPPRGGEQGEIDRADRPGRSSDGCCPRCRRAGRTMPSC